VPLSLTGPLPGTGAIRLVIKGARPPALDAIASSSAAGQSEAKNCPPFAQNKIAEVGHPEPSQPVKDAPPAIAVLLPELPPSLMGFFRERFIQHCILVLDQLETTTHAADSGKGLRDSVIWQIGEYRLHEFRRGVKELR
jgi:hypothetical protein